MSTESVPKSVSVTWSAQAQDQAHSTGRALLFMLGNTTYGVSVEFVRRVVEMPSVVPVTGSCSWFTGMTNCEGAPVPLVDTRAILNQTPEPQNLKRAIIIDCAYGTVLLAVEQITTLSDLSGKQKHHTVPSEYPAELIEYSCEANGVTIGVLNIPKLFRFISTPSTAHNIQHGEQA